MRTYSTLKRKNDFSRLYRNSTSAKGRGAVILVRQNRTGATRIGFSVSKKIGNAVKRNRARRRLREAVYKYNDRIKKGFDIVFVARTSDREMPFEKLVRDVGILFDKTGVLEK